MADGASNCLGPLGFKLTLPNEHYATGFSPDWVVNNGNCTEWSAIWSEIKRVITKSHNHEAAVLTLL